jgi:arginyl-tRNA synthetase
MVEPDPWGSFRQEAIAWASEALHAAYGIADEIDHLVEEPDPELADFAFPCHAFASEARAAPADVAEELEEALPPTDEMTVEAQGPYLNFHVEPAALVEAALEAIHERGEDYGHLPETGTRVLVEHTSANPTGPLHVGRARNPLLADSIVRLLRAAGHEVVAEYYVNDMGRQAATLVWGAKNIDLRGDAFALEDDEGETTFTYGLLDEPRDAASKDVLEPGPDETRRLDHLLVRYYQAANHVLELHEEGQALVDRDPEAEIAELIKAFEADDEEIATEFREIVTWAMKGIRASLADANVHFDNVVFESELVLDGSVQAVLDDLEALDACGVEDDGAVYLDMEQLGLETDKPQMFLRRADGTTLYGTRDVAYHSDKLDRADELVDVLGEDHKLHAQEIRTAMEALGIDVRLDVVFYNFVSLPEGSMSTRSGRVVYLDDLLEEARHRALAEVRERRGEELSEERMEEIAEMIGPAALRFNVVDVQSEKPIEFRWEKALNFEGATAPFVQYSHARTCGILDKAGLEPGETEAADTDRLEHDSEIQLARHLAQLPDLVRESAEQRKVHPVTAYAVETAQALNEFYRDCPVLEAGSPELREARLALVDAARQTLANTLSLLGIEAPRSM